jgi:hypothetical protein
VKVDILRDRAGLLVWLINCEVQRDQILCGFGWFRGGLKGAIEVFDFDSGKSYKIIVPVSVGSTSTCQAFADSKDLFQVERETVEAQV